MAQNVAPTVHDFCILIKKMSKANNKNNRYIVYTLD
jgi:hypothetical protein